MTGPEHYTTAERLLAESRTIMRPNDEGHCEADRMIAEAQVHATLAQTAALAMSQPVAGMPDEPGLDQADFDDWYAALNGLPPEARKPVEEYPGELAHLRSLLSAVKHAAPTADPEAANPLTKILIDYYSDARIVDHTLASTGTDPHTFASTGAAS